MSWRIYDEAVEMVERRHRYFPQVFRWRGRRYHVDQVEECWSVSRREWRSSIQRHFFRVRAGGGVFELFQDVKTGLWNVRRAKLAAPRVPVGRAVAAWR